MLLNIIFILGQHPLSNNGKQDPQCN